MGRAGALSRRCREDQRGATVVEFAIAAPILITLLLGIYDMGHWAYLTAVLRGAVNQAARSDSLETADTAKADAYVMSIVKGVAPGAIVTSKRVSYYDFADIKRAEAWNDKNGNGVCDRSEAYTDENRNGRWDADVGTEDNGGANDVVLYSVTVTYTPVFFIPFGTGTNTSRTISASVVKKNQPYALQEKYGSAAGTCS
ncbi:pilus assembly protein [Novosphingobium sp. FGD1]|jgi:Flp pilus assembly protein TadG|uniref:Pilus assembly protein n=1 Tax=Novosphingobium silvae TaxID=2692619 RepID=A0A7X4GE67_9SPHN|nr:TadE/TadG family type IV pilus assembly protein [Novosphingobium silvae]MYL96988.1 pilus assembly protein [Novosphingobium silvae]